MTDDPGFSTGEIRDATGKTWDEWSRIVDASGGRERTHDEIVGYLVDARGVQIDWAQLVAARYDRERLLDEGGDENGPQEVRIARTIDVPPETAFAAWTDGEQWSRWFASGATLDARPGGRYETSGGDRGEFLVVDAPHHLRFTWENAESCPGTVVDVTFAPTVDGGTHVEVAHAGLATTAERAAMIDRWVGGLQRLGERL